LPATSTSLQVGTHHIDQLIRCDRLLRTRLARRIEYVKAHVILEQFSHQAVHGAAGGSDENVFGFLRPAAINEVPDEHFWAVHPLDDVPEEKIDTSALGPMPMSVSVKLSLLTLRGYLVVMMLLVLYHVMDLAGAFGQAH
jgi:hypothetical protein